MRKRHCETRTWASCEFPCLRRILAAASATALTLILGAASAAAQVGTTTVQGTVYRADGAPASGTVLVSWNAFTTPQNQAIAAGSESATIAPDGFLSVNLTPNTGALPAGSYYTAVYHLNDGTVYPEYWVVPAAGTVAVAAVRAQLQPSTIAVASAVTPSYVQQAVSSLGATYLPLSGGTLNGALTLSGDPSGQTQAATKHYVDQSTAQSLPLSGGTLSGPVIAPVLFAKRLEGRQYSDQAQSSPGSNDGIVKSMQDCANYPYACQVVAPALYAQTEAQPWGGSYQWNSSTFYPNAANGPAYGQPTGCVEDLRFGGPQWVCNGAELPPSWAGAGANGPVMGASFSQYSTQYTNSSYFQVPPALTLNAYNYAGTYWDSYQAQFPALNIYQVNDSPAATYGININQFANAVGDTIPVEIEHFQRGGMSSGDSEGLENRITMEESVDVYRGTVNSMTNQTGSSQTCFGPCTIFSTTQTQGYKGDLGDGLVNIDLTQADSSGYISLIAAGPNNTTEVQCAGCDWDSKYGDSSAATTLSATVNEPASVNPLQPGTNVTISVVSSAGFTAGGNACLVDGSGTRWETEPITSVGANTLTLGVLRHSFQAGSTVAEGGMACMGIEMTADEVGPGYPVANVTVSGGSGMTPGTYPLTFSGSNPCGGNTGSLPCGGGASGNLIVTSGTSAYVAMTSYGNGYTSAPAVSASPGGTAPALTAVLSTANSLNGEWVQAGYNAKNVIRTVWPIAWNTAGGTLYVNPSNEGHTLGGNTRAYTQMGSGGSVSCTLSGGSLSACTASGGAGYSPAADASHILLNQPQLEISGLTCATYPAIYVAAVAGGGLSGVGISSAGSGCTGTPTVTVVPMNAYAVYPAALTLNVWNPTTGAVDGSSIATGPAAGTFNTGDTLEQEHAPVEEYTLQRSFLGGFQGGSYSTPDMIYLGGASMKSQAYETVNNQNNPAIYVSYPLASPWVIGNDRMTTPTAFAFDGAWGQGLWFQQPLFGNGAEEAQPGIIAVGCVVNGVDVCTGWNAWDILLNHANQQNNGGGQDVLEYNPSSETWQWTAGAPNQGGFGAACTVGFSAGGFSGACGGQAWTFDPSGDLLLSGSMRAQGAIMGATINGEITVDGTTYTTLNQAWTAAAAQANATGEDQTIRLGPGTFAVSATLAEPTSGVCVNLLGSAGATVNADSAQVATTLTVPGSLGGDLISLGNAQQAQGCTFQNLNVLANDHATHAFEFQWFRGLLIENVAVNDTSSDGIVLGEETTSSGHQSNFLLRNVTVSYSAAAFTPANRPNYGIHIEKTAIDSAIDDVTVRNALTAAVYNEGTGNTGYLIHGFGYPYTCTTAPCMNNASSSTAANASYAASYVIYDTGGGGTEWTDTYIDSPSVAGIYVGANGVSVEGGHIQWPDLTSFPAANLAYVASSVTNNLLIGDVSCLGMASGTNWITYAGAAGNPPTFSSVHHLTGCGNYYQALEPAVTTGFSSGGANVNDPTGAVPRVWAAPLAAASTDAAYSAQMYTGYQGDVFQAHFSGVNPFFNITSQGTIRSSGGLALSTILNTASALTLTAANRNVIANAAAGAQTITLPSCYTPLPDKSSPTGLEFTVIKSDTSSNAVTLQTVSSQNINYLGVSAQNLAMTSPGKRTLICGPDYNWYAY